MVNYVWLTKIGNLRQTLLKSLQAEFKIFELCSWTSEASVPLLFSRCCDSSPLLSNEGLLGPPFPYQCDTHWGMPVSTGNTEICFSFCSPCGEKKSGSQAGGLREGVWTQLLAYIKTEFLSSHTWFFSLPSTGNMKAKVASKMHCTLSHFLSAHKIKSSK